MTLEEFERAEAVEGYIYELSKGVAVVDVPKSLHGAIVDEVRGQIYVYRAAHRGMIQFLAAGNECKVLLPGEQSERHPDIAIYKTPRPGGDDEWEVWVPELVVEVVSPSSVRRDYEEKPQEYLQFGVAEYWIVDAKKGNGGEILVLTRSGGNWKQRTVSASERLTTRVLPGFELDTATVFAVAK